MFCQYGFGGPQCNTCLDSVSDYVEKSEMQSWTVSGTKTIKYPSMQKSERQDEKPSDLVIT